MNIDGEGGGYEESKAEDMRMMRRIRMMMEEEMRRAMQRT